MPRRSPFNVNLSSEERQTLESIARKYTSPYCDVIRAKIIVLADEGLSNDVIASRLDMPVRLSANGVSDSPLPDCLALRRSLEAGVRPAFPPSLVVQVKALACELPHTLGLPLSRLSVEEIRQHVISQGLVAEHYLGLVAEHYFVALAQQRCPSPLEASKLDLPSRSELCRQSRTHPRSLPTPLGGRSTGLR